MDQMLIGLDVHKDSIAVAIAEAGRDGEVRFWGNMPNDSGHLRGLIKALGKKGAPLHFVYEAGPCGYEVFRFLESNGLECDVVAPSRIPRRPGGRVKNDHRDAISLARLARAGELTSVWVPDPLHEAMRDLVRARHAANKDLKVGRQRIQSFLLRHDRRYPSKPWTGRHMTWLSNQQFQFIAQQITLQGYINAVEQALDRQAHIEEQMRALVPAWSLGPLVNVLQSLRGVGLIVAVTVVAEVGDIGRFENPKQLMAFLGLNPGEHSSGSKVRGRGITKSGNSSVRRLLYAAAWSYRQRPKVGAYMRQHMPADVPQEAKDIAWKAQVRLCRRYRALLGRGKKSQVAITAVARELVGFMWSIATTKCPTTRTPPEGHQAA